MAAIILMAAIGAWAVMTDRISYVITHGISMNPLYYEGDLVFVVKEDSYQVGQIAAYDGSGHGLRVLHRIVGGDPDTGFVFKGDNNPSDDAMQPTAHQLIGRAVLHVPKGGLWLKPLLSPSGLGMLCFLVAGGGMAAKRTRREIPRGRRKKKVKAMSRQGGSGAMAMTVLKAIQRLSPAFRALAVLAAVLTVFALVLGTLGWIKPIVVRKTNFGTGQSMTFSYSASVPKSAAYDGTTVLSPDPLFRKLAKRVDVHMRYIGPTGTLDVTADLVNDAGWHTSFPVLRVKKITSDTTLTTSLDLASLSDRAKAAADATGLRTATITVTLNARVTTADATAFAAPLAFSLSDLTMVLAGGAGSLVVADKPTTRIVSRDIVVFGLDVMRAKAARLLAMLFLFGAAAAAFAVYMAVRRGASLRTRAEIERRYPEILVHVEPMPSPPGKPVVNVDNFPALAKLAERYGQMVLTWRRPEADDFVVRDEGITYRYRVPLDEPTLQNVELINRPGGAGTHRRKASSSQVS